MRAAHGRRGGSWQIARATMCCGRSRTGHACRRRVDAEAERRIDALQEDAGRGRVAVREHHRVDAEGRDADDAGHLRDLLHDRAVLAEIGRVLEHEDVRVDAEDLLAELRLEAAGDAHHGRERRDAERDAEDRERRPDRDERALLRAQVAKRELDRIAHARMASSRSVTPASGVTAEPASLDESRFEAASPGEGRKGSARLRRLARPEMP